MPCCGSGRHQAFRSPHRVHRRACAIENNGARPNESGAPSDQVLRATPCAAAEYITKLRKAKEGAKAKEGREKLTTVKELGMFAMLASERGIKVVRPQAFRDAVKGQLPKPGYPAAVPT